MVLYPRASPGPGAAHSAPIPRQAAEYKPMIPCTYSEMNKFTPLISFGN